MENSEKTTAWNKAYAEIILNTAKESAARVMVSDRKSARFQHDLCGTKEEALRLLVRMKQMIDAKTIEAEITSSNQQQQIDVLEAQLQEAEDIITDLRSELRWVRDKLEKARANELQARDAVNKEKETVSAQNADQELVGSLNPTQEVADTCASISSVSLLNQSSLQDECGNDLKQFDGLSINTMKSCDACKAGLDTNARNKKLELSRNGCTQRIRALERKAPERNSSSSADVEEECTIEKDNDEILSSEKVIKNESGTWGNARCIVLALRSSNIEATPNPSNALRIKKTGKACTLRGRRKRRWGKRKTTSVRSLNRLLKPCQSHSDLPCSSTSIENSDGEDPVETHLSVESEKVDALNASEGLEEHLHLKRTLYTDDIAIMRKGKRSKNMKALGSISSVVKKPSDHLVMVCGESNLVSSNVKDGENKAYIPANETEIKPPPCLDPVLTLTKSNMDPISGSTNATVSLKETNTSTDKELRSRKEGVLVKTEGEDGLASSSNVGSEFVNVHSMSSDSKVTPVSDQISDSPKADGNRYVKYTFQRKRKKGCLSENDDNNSPGKREVEEKENNTQDK